MRQDSLRSNSGLQHQSNHTLRVRESAHQPCLCWAEEQSHAWHCLTPVPGQLIFRVRMPSQWPMIGFKRWSVWQIPHWEICQADTTAGAEAKKVGGERPQQTGCERPVPGEQVNRETEHPQTEAGALRGQETPKAKVMSDASPMPMLLDVSSIPSFPSNPLSLSRSGCRCN